MAVKRNDQGTYIGGKYLPSLVELERRRRIHISVYAYAYEYESESLISDGAFDRLASLIDVSRDTGDKALDRFFKREFQPHTGQWIHKHPQLEGIKTLYLRQFKGKNFEHLYS